MVEDFACRAGWTRSEAFEMKATTEGNGNPAVRIAAILAAFSLQCRSWYHG